MKQETSVEFANKSRVLYITMFLLLAYLILTGCATTGPGHSLYKPQIITVEEKLTVHLYNSLDELRAAYLFSGGDISKGKRVKGFYSDRTNTLHCLKWDFYTCGHELFHALQYKGDKTLYVESGYEHFKGTSYASE
jgi:hypothetical protein